MLQFINTQIYKRLNMSTLQFIRHPISSTPQYGIAMHPNLSIPQYVKTTIYQHLKMPTFQFIHTSIYICTPQFINTSINQYFNLSTPQYIYTPTFQLLNNQHLRLLTHPFYQCLDIAKALYINSLLQYQLLCKFSNIS